MKGLGMSVAACSGMPETFAGMNFVPYQHLSREPLGNTKAAPGKCKPKLCFVIQHCHSILTLILGDRLMKWC